MTTNRAGSITRRTIPAGILGFPVAPLNDWGELDLEAFGSNVKFLLNNGLDAVFVGCGAGEFHALSHEEYGSMTEAAVAAVGGRVPVYTGVGGNIRHAAALAEMSERFGADGYLILPPYLIEPEQEGLYDYVRTIIDSASLNAIVYQRDNCVLKPATVLRLAKELPRLVGLKDGLGDMELAMETVHAVGDRLEYMSGMPLAEATFQAFAGIGFRSYSSAISNYIPHISRLYFDALKRGDATTLHAVYADVILPINRIRKRKKGYAVSLIKAGMQIVGLPVGGKVRPPLVPVEPEHYAELEQIVRTAHDRYPPVGQSGDGESR